MPEHLTPEQLKAYRDRTLALGELVAVDMHLGGCEPCRTALAALADPAVVKSMVSGIDQARFHHLSYEQMDDWVEDRLEPADREMVMSHIGLCPACARQLIAYQDYAPAMAEPVRSAAQPVKVKRSFWSFLMQPQYALGAAALIAFVVIALVSRRTEPPPEIGAIVGPSSKAVESTVPSQESPAIGLMLTATAELDALPDSLRVGAKEAIEGAGRPASLKGLEASPGATLEYPRAEVVEETQPVLRWKAFGDTYDLSLYDGRGLISRRGGLLETRWTPSSPLLRDHVYTWEVESKGAKHRGMFRVLGASQEQELQKVRAQHGGSHFVIGAVSEGLGLLTPAEQQFEAMAKDPAQAQQAQKLLSQVEALRR